MKRFAKMEPYACLHLLVLVLGTALMISGCFHGGLWFDESYTVGMMRQSFGDMLRISVADVHPPFYYIALWLFTRVFGCSAVAMRLFSALCASALGVLGYTHVRRDFGRRTGLYFSLFLYLCGALLMEHLGLPKAAERIRSAVGKAIAAKSVTVDLAAQVSGARVVGCREFGEIIGENL